MRLDYNRESHSYHNKIYISMYDPAGVTDLSDLRQRDRYALDQIADLQAAIDRLQAYRLDMADRAQFLATAAYTVSVELHRHRRYKGSVEFYLEIVRTYDDGTRQTENRTTYEGRDRHKAIADYKAACKAHPGAECVLDIEKSRWER